ncbi:ribose-phosphate pyrophosphokinase [Puccinia sorghi]|uniref:ribose-phosphate diphosphokinase n=1 Tax=Puccinia sorghi TaxID=27349 RepID=A0A0L6UMU0_9BASI|nr:ribose-phosphate pyrophosphokinase [Puccinia sorghi]
MPGFSSLKLFTGTSHPALAHHVSRRLGIPIAPASIERRPSGEICVSIKESVRQADVYIIGTASSITCTTNSALMELLIMIHSCSIASAGRITAVIPHFPYARQDKKDKSRAPITAKLVANMIREAGAHHVITMDLHASQIQGFFDCPVDNLYAEPTLVQYIRENVDVKNAVIVSPDAGGAKRASSIAARLDLDFALFHKERKKANEVSRMILVGSVKGKTAILVDDMADTCGTLCLATEKLQTAGAVNVIALVTHGILSGPAISNINGSSMSKLVTTNTIPQHEHLEACSRLLSFPYKNTFTDQLEIVHLYRESISYLFDSIPWTGSAAIDYTTQANPDDSHSAKPTRPSSPDQPYSPKSNGVSKSSDQPPISVLPS